MNETIDIHKNFQIGNLKNIQVEKSAQVSICENVIFREFTNILVNGGASLTIHKNVFFNNSCSINCWNKIEIGENTLFGEGVKIYDHNHRYSINPLIVNRGAFTTSPLSIGKNCWIGSNVTILKGASIGDNVIIGANCLIYKHIPSNPTYLTMTTIYIT